jgi:hypothetical protein
MKFKRFLKRLYRQHIEPDALKRYELKRLESQHQNFKTLEVMDDTYCMITTFGHQQNVLLGVKIAKLRKELME